MDSVPRIARVCLAASSHTVDTADPSDGRWAMRADAIFGDVFVCSSYSRGGEAGSIEGAIVRALR